MPPASQCFMYAWNETTLPEKEIVFSPSSSFLWLLLLPPSCSFLSLSIPHVLAETLVQLWNREKLVWGGNVLLFKALILLCSCSSSRGRRTQGLCAHSLFTAGYFGVKLTFHYSGENCQKSTKPYRQWSFSKTIKLLWYLLPNIPELLSVIFVPIQQSLSAGGRLLCPIAQLGTEIPQPVSPGDQRQSDMPCSAG